LGTRGRVATGGGNNYKEKCDKDRSLDRAVTVFRARGKYIHLPEVPKTKRIGNRGHAGKITHVGHKDKTKTREHESRTTNTNVTYGGKAPCPRHTPTG